MADCDTYPILEFDPAREAIISPAQIVQPLPGIPERCVLAIYHGVLAALVTRGVLRQITQLSSGMGPFPVYQVEFEGSSVAVVNPGIGSPLAAGILEEMIVLGCRTFVACGDCGVLDSGLGHGTVVVPDRAVRDEGTSYHYVAPAREIAVAPQVVARMVPILQRHQIAAVVGKTWTTDGLYRETRARRDRRKAEGCITVEMECAALLAVAQFRGVTLGQFLSAGDDIGGEVWDRRYCTTATSRREKVFWLAVEACLAL